jgi:hypothetical protein
MKVNISQFEKIIKNSPFLKKLLQRRFYNKSGYLGYKEAMTRIARCYGGLSLMSPPPLHAAEWNAISCCYEVYTDPLFPVYSISDQLTKLFLQTDIPPKLKDIEKPFHQALLMFPFVDQLIDADGDRIEYIHVVWFDRQTYHNTRRCNEFIGQEHFIANMFGIPVDRLNLMSNLGDTEKYRIQCISITKNSQIIKHCFGIHEDGVISHLESRGKRSTQEIASTILLQLALYLQITSGKDSLDNDKSIARSKEELRCTESSKRARNYIHIDVHQLEKSNSRQRQEKTSRESGSVLPHWRRGHWRNARVGEGKKETKIVWIRPTLVNEAIALKSN